MEQFDNIPHALLERAFRSNPEDLELLAGGMATCIYCGAQDDMEPGEPCGYCDGNEEGQYEFGPVYGWPAAWGWLFHPSQSFEEDRIRADPEGCAKACQVLVYDSDETGILVGVDGAGYDFYEAHWIPLYEWFGYKWHEEESPTAS